MFDFNKLCDLYCNLSVAEKQNLLNVKAKGIIDSLFTVKTSVKNPTSSLAGFIIGLSALDGIINERQYLLIYPTLKHIFGEKADLSSIKENFRNSKTGKNTLNRYTKDVSIMLSENNDKLRLEIVSLCLCIATLYEKATKEELNHIKRLCIS